MVTVADGTLLDREAAASHAITVRATSQDGSVADTVFTIALADVDEFDVAAPTDSNAAADSVAENAANGSLVGITAGAGDADATTNGVSYTLTDDAGGRFAIDANTGVVSVADGSLLDREAAASHAITVRATSQDGSVADTVFTIALTDADEFDVTTPTDSNAAADSVAENAANGSLVGITAGAGDADATTNGVSYTLTDDAGGRFAIDANTGVVTVADGTLLNREAAASHAITVRGHVSRWLDRRHGLHHRAWRCRRVRHRLDRRHRCERRHGGRECGPRRSGGHHGQRQRCGRHDLHHQLHARR